LEASHTEGLAVLPSRDDVLLERILEFASRVPLQVLIAATGRIRAGNRDLVHALLGRRELSDDGAEVLLRVITTLGTPYQRIEAYVEYFARPTTNDPVAAFDALAEALRRDSLSPYPAAELLLAHPGASDGIKDAAARTCDPVFLLAVLSAATSAHQWDLVSLALTTAGAVLAADLDDVNDLRNLRAEVATTLSRIPAMRATTVDPVVRDAVMQLRTPALLLDWAEENVAPAHDLDLDAALASHLLHQAVLPTLTPANPHIMLTATIKTVRACMAILLPALSPEDIEEFRCAVRTFATVHAPGSDLARSADQLHRDVFAPEHPSHVTLADLLHAELPPATLTGGCDWLVTQWTTKDVAAWNSALRMAGELHDGATVVELADVVAALSSHARAA
jgi:hypothetical protein